MNALDLPTDVPRRSLASPGVAAAIAISIGLLCTIAWCGRDGSDGLDWTRLKQQFSTWTSRQVPDDDLPYITAIPIAAPGTSELPPEPTPAAQIALGSDGSSGESDRRR